MAPAHTCLTIITGRNKVGLVDWLLSASIKDIICYSFVVQEASNEAVRKWNVHEAVVSIAELKSAVIAN
jgi:hypothetical protein